MTSPENKPPEPSETDHATRRMGGTMIAAMWLLLLGLLTLGFQQFNRDADNLNRNPQQRLAQDGSHEVVLQRSRNGHYLADGAINGQRVRFLLDTGATDISIPARVADRLGLQRGPAMTYQTAAGPVQSYLARLDSISLGAITLHNVRASINPNVHDSEVLLGMSFLKHIEFTQRGDTLTLRQ